MPTIGSEKVARTKSFGDGDDAGVHEAEWQIGVLSHQSRGARDVFSLELLDDELSVRDRRDERFLRYGADPRLQEVGNFGENGDRNDDLPPRAPPPVVDARMPVIVRLD